MGISINRTQLKNITPIGAAQAFFKEVSQAQQENARWTYEARRDYNKAIPWIIAPSHTWMVLQPVASGALGALRHDDVQQQ